MLDERSLKLDLFALGLLALTVLLALALLTYDPADPPARLVYPAHQVPQNVCGRGGALLAHLLFTLLGVGAYYLIASGIVCSSVLIGQRRVSEPWLRGLGWLVSLAGLTTLAAMAAPTWSPGPVIGSGGYLGAALRGWLELHFASLGAYVLLVSLSAGGLLLCTDYVLVRLSAQAVRVPARGVTHGFRQARGVYQARRAARPAPRLRSDLESSRPAARRVDEDSAGDDTTLSVRIAGRNLPPRAVEQKAQDEPDAIEESAEETSEQPTAAEPADGPRIRKPGDRRQQEREQLLAAIEEASNQQPEDVHYELPSLELLLETEPIAFEEHEQDVRRKARILEKTFANFGFQVRVVEIETGPVIAQFEVELEAGLRLSRITSLADDLAIALRVPSVRIVAPIPGKNTVGIEVPNNERQLVRLREVMEETNSQTAKMRIPIFLGKDVAGKPMVVDLTSLPHLLIAGRTGTGKSVCLNTIIMSLLMTRRPDEVKMLLVDPKMVELTPYARIPHLMHPVVTDMKKAEAILGWAVDKMEERYSLLARAGVRHISVYNQLGEEELIDRLQPEDDEERAQIPLALPYIVIVADEMADLMMTAPKEVESHIIRLAQKSRAVGIHLVLATQKPTVDVITGLIKSNLPARIAFQVASRTDSRVVLDEMGADKLLGNGDLLFLWPGTSTLLRGQGAYVSDDEINHVAAAVAQHEPQFVHELVNLPLTADAQKQPGAAATQRDELYGAAVEIVIGEGRGSVSLLQRSLGIGYGRAARLIDYMAEDGVVGQYNGSQAREVIITLDQWRALSTSAAQQAPPPLAPVRPARSNRLTLAERQAEEDPAAEPSSEAPARRGKKRSAPAPAAPWEMSDDDEDEQAEWDAEDDDVLGDVDANGQDVDVEDDDEEFDDSLSASKVAAERLTSEDEQAAGNPRRSALDTEALAVDAEEQPAVDEDEEAAGLSAAKLRRFRRRRA